MDVDVRVRSPQEGFILRLGDYRINVEMSINCFMLV